VYFAWRPLDRHTDARRATAAYLAQIGLPALAGTVAGTALGDWRVLPLINGGNSLFHINVTVPLWIDLAVPAGMLVLTGLAAAVPALRAGRLRAVQAITAGQAPRAGRGYAAHRLAARMPLTRPVTAGLAAPFTRPARSAVTLAAITFGLTAVVLATGLNASLGRIGHGGDLWQHAVVISPGSGPSSAFTASQQQAVAAALPTQPGTLSYSAVATTPPSDLPGTGSHPWAASVPGVGKRMPITAFQANAAGFSWDIADGHWYTGPGQVVINTAYPATARLAIGQAIDITVGGKTATAKITGKVYDPGIGPCSPAGRPSAARPAWPSTSTSSRCGPASSRRPTPRRWARRWAMATAWTTSPPGRVEASGSTGTSTPPSSSCSRSWSRCWPGWGCSTPCSWPPASASTTSASTRRSG
jgi:putative ABC transport system permease protein